MNNLKCDNANEICEEVQHCLLKKCSKMKNEKQDFKNNQNIVSEQWEAGYWKWLSVATHLKLVVTTLLKK